MRSSAFRHFIALSTFAVFIAACSSGTPPGGDGSSGASGGAAGAAGGANTGGDDNGGFVGTGGDGSGALTCVPTTCEALEKNCGLVADGCGGVIDCGGCPEGALCGVQTANVCATVAELCTPATQEEACEGKQCGVEGDGCGGVIECGSCPSGEACGLLEPFQCAAVSGGTDFECVARIESCAEVGARCGVIGNGCGGTIDCNFELGPCPTGELCGVDEPYQCAPFAACVPLAAEDVCPGRCGKVSNGCGPEVDGGVIDCDLEGYGCGGGETCGGGELPGVCGSGGPTCQLIPQLDACAGKECGIASNGCGGAHECGSGCATGTQCNQGQCVEVEGCTPSSKASACAGKECGVVGDGCGGIHECGSCGSGEQCGAVLAYQCDPPGCHERSQAEACAGKECGTALDGCGTGPEHEYNCGTCAGGEICGLQQAFQCDAPPAPNCSGAQSCEDLGWACGIAVNACGQTFDCESEGRECATGQTCIGGNNGPTTCATIIGGTDDCALCDAVPPCTNQAQVTRLTGRVITPGQSDANTQNHVRVPNAFVYILRNDDLDDLPAIGTGIPSGGTSCDRCEDQDLGPVLAGAVSDANGEFVLEGNIPVGQRFILVTKIGKFRRAQRITIPSNRACQTTNLPVTLSSTNDDVADGLPVHDNPTRLPRTMNDGLGVNIPRIAVTTGAIDAMECVFYKMGLSANEFGNYSAGSTRRVHLYRGATAGSPQGASISGGGTPHDEALYGSLSRLEQYDMVVSDCEGGAYDSSFSQRNASGENLRRYVNRGGRLFASHLSFTWLSGNGSAPYDAATAATTGLNAAATWNTGLYLDNSGNGLVSIGRTRASPRIELFEDWMINESVIASSGATFAITDPRSMATGLGTSTEEFVYRNGASDPSNRVQQFAFNTPYAAPSGAACGRVAYSGFHVAATGGGNTPFQSAIFPSHCTDSLANNGNLTPQEKVLLFMLFDLGTCVGEEPEAPPCEPVECGANQCGVIGDGCGGTQNCGDCTGNAVCQNNQCVVQCVPTTCEAEGVACSTIADGCGGVLECDCNVCERIPQEQACSETCGYQSDGCDDVYYCGDCPNGCVPLRNCPPGINCGIISDGCNGTLNCGACPSGEVCGVHEANVCDDPTCRPLTCYEINAGCGVVGDGCGGTLQCGSCPPGQICTVVGGVPNQCAGCVPLTQGAACAGKECGKVGDGCGGEINCGSCTVPGEVCGAVSPNQCDPGLTCTPQTCEQAGAECGKIGNGCGGVVDCGSCEAGEVCGLLAPNQCAGCTPRTCESAGANCGAIGDGCGGQLDCGVCPAGSTCGLGKPNVCGRLR